MGGHSTVVSELESLTARYPLRERMWANLMLALYRSGRQAEALSTYERARQVLGEELGADPSPELQRLHEQILTRAPDLAAPQPERARPPSVRSSRVDLQPGTEVAGYRIVGTLGRGGMSVVYLAEHDWLQRKVALKVLAPQLAEDERFRERFVRESRLAASLDHPNVIPIYEAGASGGDLFIAMRYVEGTDLRTLLHEGGALEPGRAVAIVRQVAAALDAAHEQGLVHRDVKPGNVLLARQRGSEAGEHVYLSDFGLTKRSASDSGITGTGQFVGTLDYAAPEQFKGGTPDARTDVYSLGCVLFECLTGSPPFTSENDAGLMYAHLQEPPPSLTARRRGLPREIDEVVAKAMAKAPADRQPAAGALADEAARRSGSASRASATAEGRTRSRRLAPALAVAVALVLGVVASSILRGRRHAGGRARRSAHLGAGGSAEPDGAPHVPDRRPRPVRSRGATAHVPSGRPELRVPAARSRRPDPRRASDPRLPDRRRRGAVRAVPDQGRDGRRVPGQREQQAGSRRRVRDRHLAVGSYTIGGEPAGRVLCYTVTRSGRFSSALPAQSHIEWTDENASIYAHAIRNDLGDLSLYEWWLTSSGPLLPSEDAVRAKDPPPGLAPSLLQDGTYLVAPKKGCLTPGSTCALHVDGTDVLGCARRRAGTERDGYPPAGEAEPGRVLARVRLLLRTPSEDPRPAAYTVRRDERRAHVQNDWRGDLRRASADGLQSCRWTRAPAGTSPSSCRGRSSSWTRAGPKWRYSPSIPRHGRTAGRTGLPTDRGSSSPVRAKRDYDLYVMNADGSGLDADHPRAGRRERTGLVARREPDRLRLRRPRPRPFSTGIWRSWIHARTA